MSLIKITLLGCITKHCRVLKVIAYYLYLSFLRYSRIEKIFCTKMIKLKKHASRLQVHIYLKKKNTHTNKKCNDNQIVHTFEPLAQFLKECLESVLRIDNILTLTLHIITYMEHNTFFLSELYS